MSYVGLLGAIRGAIYMMAHLKVEIIHIVPIVNHCMCCQESFMVHFQCLHRLLVITAAELFYFSQWRKACMSH